MRAYLDHAATSPMPDQVLQAYTKALKLVGNPASTHTHGQQARELLESSREHIARRVDCEPSELILTSGGTESINLALKGMYWARVKAGRGPVILIAEGEHHASLDAATWLRDEHGARLHFLPIDATGLINPQNLSEAIDQIGADQIALLTFIMANNEVGTVQPVDQLCRVAQAWGIPTHVDAVAALGQIPLNFSQSGASAMSVSAHKIGGPVGVGALMLARGAVAEPLFHGGSQQRVRSGTQNTAGAVAFAEALTLAVDECGRPHPERIEHLVGLRNMLIDGVRSLVPDAVLQGAPAEGRLAGNAHFTFDRCQGDSLVYLLDQAGISVSVGSACSAGVNSVSHVLMAMGLAQAQAAGALRFSIGSHTSEDEIRVLLEALPAAVATARNAGLA